MTKNAYGKVHLIGAGPGDPGLLTLRGKEILERCDVLVYDFLANPEFLKLCREDCEKLYVGKKGGDHTLPQGKINELIVEKAKEGRMVARLKGGDPYVFGRGAEEAEELLESGVSFEVVPGVTSGVAAAAYAGIPVTHRSHTPSVAFITGHEDPTKEKSLHDWDVYARSQSTLVFYMGVKNLPMIAERLMAAGKPADTPVALVRWGTTCRQRHFVSTLDKVADEAERLGFSAPSIIIVGGVCSLSGKLDFFSKRPLLGKGVVVTRAREQSSGLVRILAEMGACVYEFPTIEVQPLADYEAVEKEIVRLPAYDWLVFTSVNGVKHFWKQLAEFKLDSRALGGLSVAAIGPATAQALEERGILPDFVPPKYVAESVVEGLLERGIKDKRVLIPRALEAREVLPEELARAGAEVKVLPVYETMLAQSDADELLAALREGDIHCVTFTSSSTVHNFFKLVDPETIKARGENVKLACIGPVTADTLAEYGLSASIRPDDYTVPALAQALAEEL